MRNKKGNDFGNREGFHDFSEREGRNDSRQSFNEDSMTRSERNDYRHTSGSNYGSQGNNYGSSYTSNSDYDYNRAGYRGDSSGFSGQGRGEYGSGQNQSWNRGASQDWERAPRSFTGRYDQDYSTRRALEDREIGVNANSPSNYEAGQHAGKGPKGYRRSDDRLKEDVCEALARHSEIDASEVEVDVVEGVVTLSGTVESRQTKRMAEDLVDGLVGITEIKNDLRVITTPDNAQRARMSSSFDSTKNDSMDYGRASSASKASKTPANPTTGKSVQ